jgi:hypothetical protein
MVVISLGFDSVFNEWLRLCIWKEPLYFFTFFFQFSNIYIHTHLIKLKLVLKNYFDSSKLILTIEKYGFYSKKYILL